MTAKQFDLFAQSEWGKLWKPYDLEIWKRAVFGNAFTEMSRSMAQHTHRERGKRQLQEEVDAASGGKRKKGNGDGLLVDGPSEGDGEGGESEEEGGDDQSEISDEDAPPASLWINKVIVELAKVTYKNFVAPACLHVGRIRKHRGRDGYWDGKAWSAKLRCKGGWLRGFWWLEGGCLWGVAKAFWGLCVYVCERVREDADRKAEKKTKETEPAQEPTGDEGDRTLTYTLLLKNLPYRTTVEEVREELNNIMPDLMQRAASLLCPLNYRGAMAIDFHTLGEAEEAKTVAACIEFDDRSVVPKIVKKYSSSSSSAASSSSSATFSSSSSSGS
uniref:Uncharacterized protein n=1 Tax=Chromera velia CCMP2878 TaxID=1169474 RepID=A0A0G4F0B7_9ALVE|eukprot:Cvel_14440.t1-p1 / transcript=Cvel_14440.t1 / gene=Cvel_14440 / organism=Chromera_velia_CCMP2878 / gene_product=hypothetical protein / transcript_product=hypothetical protein / location=Cvel_scaffold1027:41492-51058(+) / protein_length=329 / sequence_SO=supercontig / SO=protein_coding / is_pseudo=false